MNNPTPQRSPALRIEAGSCFFISLKKHDHSESLPAEKYYMLLYYRIITLILYACRNAQSIKMITDGRGNVIAGGNNGGKSHISYTPYGSIHRTDSSGPDITRFKFTGQEEDKETGLMYYKARYYDPMIGRFAQADSVVMPESTFGMNRYMYTEGSPVNYRDVSGHNKNNQILGAIVGYAMAGQQGAVMGAYAMSGSSANVPKDVAGGAKWASKGISGAANTMADEGYNGRKKYLGAYIGSQVGGQFNLSPEQGAAIGMYAASGKTNIGRDMGRGARWAGRGGYGAFAEIMSSGGYTRNEDDWDRTGIATAWQKNIVDPLMSLSFENAVVFVVGAVMFVAGAIMCIGTMGWGCAGGVPLMAMGARGMASALGGDTDGSSSTSGYGKGNNNGGWSYHD
jgi:RHS repeat-associated protein